MFICLVCCGIVDVDGCDVVEVVYLEIFGVVCLFVVEIENLILLLFVSRVIVEGEGFGGVEFEVRLMDLVLDVFLMLEYEFVIEV